MGNLKNHPGMWLRDDAARALNALEDKYGKIVLNSAGRTVGEQQELINRWDRGGPANRPPFLFPPARPASRSNHIGGIAVDVYNYTDDRAKLQEFGFQWYGPSDKVHYTFTGWTPPSPPPAPAAKEPAKNIEAPATKTKRKRTQKMNLIWDNNGTGYLVTDLGMTGLTSPLIYNLFYRLINSDQSLVPFYDSHGLKHWVGDGGVGNPDVFNQAEVGIINHHLQLIAVSALAGVQIDTAKLQATIGDALGDVKLSEASAEALAEALDLAIPRIAAAVRKQIIKD